MRVSVEITARSAIIAVILLNEPALFQDRAGYLFIINTGEIETGARIIFSRAIANYKSE